jgi:Flp pilus assembly pilin Flp
MTIISTLKGLAQDEEGAVSVEYHLLLGILLLAAIPTIGLIADWISDVLIVFLDAANSYCRVWLRNC